MFFLTIDARIQAIADEALRAVSRAGAVVVDPNNGNVLAMVSVPSFDPNTFIPSIKAKDWQALQKDEGDPLVNRAISALPPGSTFKIVTALAGFAKKAGERAFQLQRRCQLRRPLFQMLGRGKTLHPRNARTGRCDQSFVRLIFLPIRKRGRHSVDRRHRQNDGLGRRIGHSSDRRTNRQYAGAGMDADSSSAGKMVAGANGQRFDRPGLHAGFAAAIGHGLRGRGQWRHVLLPALGR